MTYTKLFIAGASLAAAASSQAFANGFDRNTYSPNILFETGNYFEASYAVIDPTVDADAQSFPAFGISFPSGIDDMAPTYQYESLGLKLDLTDRVAVAFQTFNALGTDIDYGAIKSQTILGDLGFIYPTVSLDGRAYTATAKYNLENGFSIYGGLKHMIVDIEASTLLPDSTRLRAPIPPLGLGPGDPNPFGPPHSWDFDAEHGTGYIAGIAYEKPDIALRVSLTYESEIEFDFPTTTNDPRVSFPTALGGFGIEDGKGTTTGKSPEAWELYFQTGIAPGTLLFGSVRHASWGDANINLFNSALLPITDFGDQMTYQLGLGKQLTNKWSVSVSGKYIPGTDNPSVLQPRDGQQTLSGGAKYKINENLELSGGISYTWLGDNVWGSQIPGSNIPPVAFQDNNVLSGGVKVGLRF
jgi:long-chain fatty acid transport protein